MGQPLGGAIYMVYVQKRCKAEEVGGKNLLVLRNMNLMSSADTKRSLLCRLALFF